jgi:hypothetical protein
MNWHDLYFYYNAEGRLIYIGISITALMRQAGHKADAWYHEIAVTQIFKFPSRGMAKEAEAALIDVFRPKYNKKHNPDFTGSPPKIKPLRLKQKEIEQIQRQAEVDFQEQQIVLQKLQRKQEVERIYNEKKAEVERRDREANPLKPKYLHLFRTNTLPRARKEFFERITPI